MAISARRAKKYVKLTPLIDEKNVKTTHHLNTGNSIFCTIRFSEYIVKSVTCATYIVQRRFMKKERGILDEFMRQWEISMEFRRNDRLIL